MSINAVTAVDELDVLHFKNQLMVARNEINNLRQQIRALNHSHQQEVNKIQCALDAFQLHNCSCSAGSFSSHNVDASRAADLSTSPEDGTYFRYIGVVTTWFPKRKAIPRQPGICASTHGKLILSKTVFTNPEHSLEGLSGFSHMWILFHFHKNDSTHVRAKVTPPRLNGCRTGVFGTRSPHRPSPIGLSLVSIDQVEGCCVHFSGVDMMDGTPVLDIKPYIPHYDNPAHYDSAMDNIWCNVLKVHELDGDSTQSESAGIDEAGVLDVCSSTDVSPTRLWNGIGEREAPDGEERELSATATALKRQAPRGPLSVRVPAWIDSPPVTSLTVIFSNKAEDQLDEVGQDAESVKTTIQCVLREDPRSVYLREKWYNQCYTFLIRDLHVTCKFDDSIHTVFVFQVKSAGKKCICGQLEWQCSIHGDKSE